MNTKFNQTLPSQNEIHDYVFDKRFLYYKKFYSKTFETFRSRIRRGLDFRSYLKSNMWKRFFWVITRYGVF